ncbi:DoxX family protein [Xanthobacter dioxanivorans]|uniref:DoxX family protein n=1 Tax=Xanthobacter dioxanivorans TaxID=2528964 RepID=A0A974PK20_9HYPH|nr:DoxX family protein [Xanthobacter dioxanivorans]QRG04716.1 DoxX family protein [Xanthobacter dioxanivorans]
MVDPRTAPYGLLLLRLALGLMWISHALLKVFVFTVPGFAGFLTKIGMPPALALPIIAVELIGGILIVAGIYARQVAILLIPIMLGALNYHAPNGWVFSVAGGGWEYPAFLVVASLTLALAGEGAYALRPAALIPGGRRAVA